jgi:UPF0755 protein
MPSFKHDRKFRLKIVSKRFIILALSLSLFLASFGAFFWYRLNISAFNGSDQDSRIVTIEQGMNDAQVAGLLDRKSIIRSAAAYEVYVRLNGKLGKVQAGSYELRPSMTVADIVRKITAGEVAVNLVTILPAQRIDQIKEAFIQKGYSSDEVTDALNPENYSDHPVLVDKPPLASLEGYLYPESFQTTAATPLSAVIRQSLDITEEAFTPKIVASLQEKGLNKHQAITLASIVEKEVSSASGDRPQVAQVYLRRLSIGMRLEADPTAKYGTLIATGDVSGWRQFDSRYNTYLYEGLPLGPISNVSFSSVEAVAFPAEGDYLYFVAGDPDENNENKTYFSRTLAEHEALTAQYCIKLCSSY